MILSVNHLSKSYDGNGILKDVSFHIEANDKLAVTGINGAGKTTLLRQIVGEESPDGGTITIPKSARIGYLSQLISYDSDRTVYDEVLSVKQYLLDMEEELRVLEQKMHMASEDDAPAVSAADASGGSASGGDISSRSDSAANASGGDAHAKSAEERLEDIYSRYALLSHRFETEGGYAVRSNVAGILRGLGFSEEDYSKKMSVLSGGQKTRLALGRLLMDAPEILVLDEPTNHLDISSVSWLESYLKAWRGAVILVSHDRYFLDRIVNKVLDIDNGTARLYTGNYSAFAEKKAALRKDQMRAWLNNQAEIRHQQEVIEKLRRFNREKSIKRAESREKALAKIDRVDKPFDVEDAMKLHFTPSKISGKDVLFAEGLSKSYGSSLLFSGVDLDVRRGEKLAVIGPNGTGKTTLLKILVGLEQADSGEIEFGAKVEPAYYDQEHHELDPDNTVFDEISDAYPYMNNTEIRNLLASFLFTGDDVFKQIRDLSGGEQGRVSLAKLMLSKANLLLLDEPTNHLDITSREILEEAVRNYEGTVIYVSHDRYFINRTATRILELDHGHFVNYQGNYDYYLEKQNDAAFDKSRSISGSSSEPAERPEAKSAAADPVRQEKLSYAEQKEHKQQLQKLKNKLAACEAEIAAHEKEIARLDEEISLPENASNSARLNELTGRQAQFASELESLYEKWEQLSEALETE
ncbi:MAG: ABC-F family ATP-binding cassette domain-containing protein [Lachnospiraceae bacterium]|nr:ABC-F family ATP-binding cassette domain-containing protein [Lachnospiraceae bacterium]